MFWLGMSIFIVLAALPVISATALNAKDGASLTDDQQDSLILEER